ncbi:PilW family protein [Aquimonas sp.]|uniref:PilW family protein n=1 Tax=Aquimonas sp. TaxID=1872588 RepID=UPI0037BEE66C
MNKPLVHRRRAKAKRQVGLSLIELMVAMGIGVVLLLGLAQIFGASRAAFSTAEGGSRVQENSRFAVDFLRRDLRMVGHMGCMNERGYIRQAPLLPRLYLHSANPSSNFAAAPYALRLDWPLDGFEYNGSAPGETVDLSGGVAASGGPGSYSPALPGALGAVAADAIAGSDVIVLRYLSGDAVRSAVMNIAANTMSITNAADIPFFEPRGIYGISNCRQVSLFQAQGAGAVVPVGQGGLNLVNWSAAEDGYASPATAVYRYEYVVYYVGIDGATNEPALRQRRLEVGSAGLLSAPVTLVEGVESMQLVYGVDTGVITPTVNTRDDVLDEYRVASTVGGLAPPATPALAWQQVVNVRVGLLMRSPAPAAAIRDDASPLFRAADTAFLIDNDDNRVRQVYETVITLRNRVRN